MTAAAIGNLVDRMPENSKWSQTPQDWGFHYFHPFRYLGCIGCERAILGSVASLAWKKAAERRAG
jgi:hypothetical protein